MKHAIVLCLLAAACAPPDVPTATPPDIEIETQTFAVTRAQSLPPSGCAEATSGLDYVRSAHELMNRIRREMGLPCFNYVDQLAVSGIRHSSYLARHIDGACVPGMHTEVPGCSGFHGVTAPDRMLAAGLGWPYKPHYQGEITFVNNTFATTLDNHEEAIEFWLRSVYHRLPFIDTRLRASGLGRADWNHGFGHRLRAFTTNFGKFDPEVAIPGAHDMWVSKWPPPDATGIPRDFNACEEVPSPPHPAGCMVGIPVSLAHPRFTPANSGTSSAQFRLWLHEPAVGFVQVATTYLDGNTDPSQVLTDGHYFLVPHSPLLANRWYLAQAFGNLWSGEPFASSSTAVTIEWWFATGN